MRPHLSRCGRKFYRIYRTILSSLTIQHSICMRSKMPWMPLDSKCLSLIISVLLEFLVRHSPVYIHILCHCFAKPLKFLSTPTIEQNQTLKDVQKSSLNLSNLCRLRIFKICRKNYFSEKVVSMV